MQPKLKVKTKKHRSAAAVPPELKKDIAWFRRHPTAIERSRRPSARERREWGPGVIDVLVLRLEDGGFATIPMEAAHT